VKKLAILGSTGSIGHSALSICESFPDRYQVVSLAAGSNIDVAYDQCLRWRPKAISLATEELAATLKTRLKAAGITNIEILHGTLGAIHIATLPEVNFVV
jgi:1-deoxy-D-xylulose-5-phosphate reductoisomerase